MGLCATGIGIDRAVTMGGAPRHWDEQLNPLLPSNQQERTFAAYTIAGRFLL